MLLDKLCREIVKPLFNGLCASCQGQGSDVHHILHKGANPTHRHQINNLIYLCRSCHDMCHANPNAEKEWLADNHPRHRDYWEGWKHKSRTDTYTVKEDLERIKANLDPKEDREAYGINLSRERKPLIDYVKSSASIKTEKGES